MTNSNNSIRSGIHDNYLREKMGIFLKNKITKDSELSIVSAFFTIYAYDALKENLDQISKLRFLFGEPRFIRTIDPDRTEAKTFSITDEDISLSNCLQQKRVALDCANWIKDKKIEIHSINKANFLHGKMYHITKGPLQDVILGSSNFTVRGLGLSTSINNIELNMEINDQRDREDLKDWFDSLWNNEELTKDVKDEVLKYLEKLYRNISPEFIYYKTLFHIFEDYLSKREKEDIAEKEKLIIDSQIWNYLFDFQKDGVKGAINKIMNYGGCILADSVGLGKTYEALAIIKYFELQNYRVLVLCPKKLKDNWTVFQASVNSELNPFPEDRFGYTVLSHTDLSREKGFSGNIDLENFNWGNYDLVVIDESHNFRNNTKGRKDEENNLVRKSRYERLMEDIIKGNVKTRVLMLSATPVNTSLKDLRNQIFFITEGRDETFQSTLGIPSLNNLIISSQKSFTEWAKNDNHHETDDLLNKLSPAFFRLLDGLTIARARKHVQKYYLDTVLNLGGFPERKKPIPIYTEIDLQKEFPSYDELNNLISEYQLSLFKPSSYLKVDRKSKYEMDGMPNFNQEQREKFLIGMMKVGFLKRLESSIHSFTISMLNTLNKIDNLLARIAYFETNQSKLDAIDFDDLEIESDEDDELQDALDNMTVGKKLKIQLVDLDVNRWKHDLQDDRKRIQAIYDRAICINSQRDAKLAQLKDIISDKVQNPTYNKLGKECKKVLLFTAFANTAVYLYDNLKDWARIDLGIHIALVTGDGQHDRTTFGRADFNHILINFSPTSKSREKIYSMQQNEEIDLLIATDCISEGQNLQDCDLVVNYDIHWNPVRIIQRFGRIDRIGSLHEKVGLVNFWPTKDLDRYISLKNRVEARMALVDVSAAADDNPLDVDQIKELIKDDLTYRDKQLLRLRDEVMDLEDFNETVDLTDFSFEDFRNELNRYIESNRKQLEDAPLGLNCIVPVDENLKNARPGVLFCLKQKNSLPEQREFNPIQPFFLVYILDDGSIRYSFTQAKASLDLMRGLCAGKNEAFERLCELFDQQTENGRNMENYSDLLQKSVKSIIQTLNRRIPESLTINKNATIPPIDTQARDEEDFELITWVVIKDE